jgi:NAD(P)-dependent dehydrogenase (short-subunit alcohol dehydrogenase family)
LNKNYNRPREQAIYPSLAGKRVVITGGGSGIGAGIVKPLRGRARGHLLDIAEQDSRALQDSLSSLAAPPKFVHCDLTDLEQVARVFEEIGTVDILINNAANDDRHSIGT